MPSTLCGADTSTDYDGGNRWISSLFLLNLSHFYYISVSLFRHTFVFSEHSDSTYGANTAGDFAGDLIGRLKNSLLFVDGCGEIKWEYGRYCIVPCTYLGTKMIHTCTPRQLAVF